MDERRNALGIRAGLMRIAMSRRGPVPRPRTRTFKNQVLEECMHVEMERKKERKTVRTRQEGESQEHGHSLASILSVVGSHVKGHGQSKASQSEEEASALKIKNKQKQN